LEIAGVSRWVGGSSFASATPFELQPGREFQIDEVESGLQCRLEGPGLWAHPVGWIRVYNAAGAPVTPDLLYGAANFGSVPNLRPGAYYVHVGPDPSQPWRPMWYEQADSVSAATPVVISSPGEVVPVVLRLLESDAGPRPAEESAAR
jgi:hypothetical protein